MAQHPMKPLDERLRLVAEVVMAKVKEKVPDAVLLDCDFAWESDDFFEADRLLGG